MTKTTKTMTADEAKTYKLDAAGLLHRPNGHFASRVERMAWNKAQLSWVNKVDASAILDAIRAGQIRRDSHLGSYASGKLADACLTWDDAFAPVLNDCPF